MRDFTMDGCVVKIEDKISKYVLNDYLKEDPNWLILHIV